MESRHALVIGASGLAGWGVVNALLSNYPSQNTFQSVTACVNRPIAVEATQWPVDKAPSLHLIHGVDLTKGSSKDLESMLKTKMGDSLERVTQVYYYAYKPEDDTEREIEVNTGMLGCLVEVLDRNCALLQSVVFPSGLKAYNLQDPTQVFQAPLVEEAASISGQSTPTTHYEHFRRILNKACQGKDWTWSEVIPDAVIGFAPNGSAFTIVSHWATYFSCIALVEGANAIVAFPGTKDSYNALFTEASSDMIGRLSIWASLHPDKAGGGQRFNVADSAVPSSMSIRWPQLAAYFGLIGVGPEDGVVEKLLPSQYVQKHQQILQSRCKRPAEIFKAAFLDQYGFWLAKDRQFSMVKARKAGFTLDVDPSLAWIEAFDRLRAAGMLPVL